MSFTTTIFPIIAALLAPEGKFLEKNTLWNPINAEQKYLLENLYTTEVKQKLSLFSDEELKFWASKDHNELNKIAKDHGFNIQLEPFTPDGFGSLSILDVTLKWKEKGKNTILRSENVQYKAAELKSGFEVFKMGYKHPVVKINTKNDDIVYMTIADESINAYSVLLEKIKLLQNEIEKNKSEIFAAFNFNYDKLVFPCVDLDHKVDITWLTGLYEKKKDYFISQALQQTKFKMDAEGARVKSAVLIGFERTCIKEEKIIRIDKPFFIWIERKDAKLPIFAGYIDQADWQLA